MLNLTGLFSFVAAGLGIPIALATASMLCVIGLYLIRNYKRALLTLRKKDFFYWSCFMILWPMATLVYSDFLDLRALAVNTYLVALAFATAIFVTKVGAQKSARVFLASACITVAGLLLSILHADFFRTVAEVADAKSDYLGRAYGFFLQPNSAANNLSFLYVVVVSISLAQHNASQQIATAVFVLSLLLTGSRSGVAVGMTLVIYVLSVQTRKSGFFAKRGFLKTVTAVTMIVAVFVAADDVSRRLENNASSRADFGLYDRLQSIQKLDIGERGTGSVAARLVVFFEHLEGIRSRPLFGFGLAGSSNLVEAGSLSNTAHNQYLQIAFDYGVAAPVIFALLLIRLYRFGRRFPPEIYPFDPAAMLAVATAVACIFSTDVLNSRVFFAALGFILGLTYFSVQNHPVRHGEGK